MNMQFCKNYITLLIIVSFTNILQADNDSRQRCLYSCLNLLKQIKQLKHLNQLGILEEHPEVIMKESKYILSKLDEFYKEVYNTPIAVGSLFDSSSQDMKAVDDEVTDGQVLQKEDKNANLLQEVELITLKTKELIQRMNEIKFPKRNNFFIATESELQG